MNNLIKLEKGSIKCINKNFKDPYTTLFNEWWVHFVLNYGRIEPKADKVVIDIHRGHIQIKYTDYQNFTWEFFDSTYSKLINKYKMNISKDRRDSFSLLDISSTLITGEAHAEVDVSDLLLTDKSNDTLVNVRKYTRGLNLSTDSSEIVFETLLNIAQHEYRVHSKLSCDILFKLCFDYARKEIMNTEDMSKSICHGDTIIIVFDDNNIELNGEFIINNNIKHVYFGPDVSSKYIEHLQSVYAVNYASLESYGIRKTEGPKGSLK